MFRSALLCGGSALAVAASLYGSQAFAATAAAADTSPSVGEIVVVAEKREQRIESVPVAITAYSAEQRKLMGIEIVQDLADFTPSLNWTDINDRLYIRGIGRNSDNLNNTSGVAVYYNGIYYGANAAIELQKDDLFIGNIEVDAGPQNTLHGSNSDGGVVNFVQQRPTDTPYAEVRAGVQNLGEEFIEGIISGPINDHWKFRLGGNTTVETGGNFDNLDGPPQGGNMVLGGGGNSEYLEAQLQGHYDHFDLWTMVSSGDFAGNSKGAAVLGNVPDSFTNAAILGLVPSDFYGLCGLPGVPATTNGAGCAGGPPIVPGSVKTDPVTANVFPGNNPGNINPRNFIQEFNSINDQQRNVQVSVNATWHADNFDVTYLGGYQQFHYILEFPTGADAGVTSYQLEGAPNAGAAFLCGLAGFSLASCEAPLSVAPAPDFTLFDEYDQSFSHELNIVSTGSSPFQYIGGLYWYHEHWNQPVDADVDPAQPQLAAPSYSGLLGQPCAGGAILCAAPLNPSDAAASENTEINYNSYAIFGQGSYKFNDQWKVSGAVRYTEDEKKGWEDARVLEFAGSIGGLAFLGPGAFGANTPAMDITAIADAASLGKAFPGAGPAYIDAATGNEQRTLNQSSGAWTGEADIDWTPDPSLLFYGKYSRGYKAGGWSTYALGANPETQPEYVDAFEIGGKKSVSAFTLNADAFYYNYYSDQVPLTIEAPVTNQLVGILYNIPLVHDYGVELTGSWRPTDALAFNLTYSYLSAIVAKSACVEDTVDPTATQPGVSIPIGSGSNDCYANQTALNAAKTAGAVAQSIVGETIPGATPNKVSFNALYTLKFEPGRLTLSGTVIWRDATYWAVFNRWYNQAPDNTQVNLRATWSSADDHYNIIAFANNLFNSLGYDGQAGLLFSPGDIITTPALTAPREFGIQFQYRWK
jgi:iron complex outermembrane receptor protein